MNETIIRRFTKPILVLVGAPGTGKSTISQKLSVDLKLPLFSTGTYLRNLINSKEQAPLVKEIKECMMKGKLIDSSIIMKVIEDQLVKEEKTSSKAIIFDGCPRNKFELDAVMKFGNIKGAIHLYTEKDILLTRLMGRLECQKCRRTYNCANICRDGYVQEPLLPTKDPNRCDDCGGDLAVREDDKAEVMLKRLNEYYNKTFPLIKDVYAKKGLLKEVVMYKGIKEYPKIRAIIVDMLNSI